MKRNSIRMLYILLVLMLVVVTDVAGRRYRVRVGSRYSGSSSGAESSGSLTVGKLLGIVSGVIVMGFCIRCLPLGVQTRHL